jgi:hypothetical protein
MTLLIATMNAELYSIKRKKIHSGMIPKLDNCFNSLSRGVQKNTNRPPACCKMMMLFARNRVIKCPHTKPSPRMSRNEYLSYTRLQIKILRLRGKTKIKWKHRDLTQEAISLWSTNRNSFLFNWREKTAL